MGMDHLQLDPLILDDPALFLKPFAIKVSEFLEPDRAHGGL